MSLQDKHSAGQTDHRALRGPISRRDMIKASGLVAIGLAYSKPFVETVNAKPAFDTCEYFPFCEVQPTKP